MLRLTGFLCNLFRNHEFVSLNLKEIDNRCTFNKDLVNHGLAKKILVVGEQYSGKTNLLLALTDIVDLVCKHDVIRRCDTWNVLGEAESSFRRLEDDHDNDLWFEYCFEYGKYKVTYKYHKPNFGTQLGHSQSIDPRQIRRHCTVDVLEINGIDVAKTYRHVFDNTLCSTNILEVIKNDQSGFEFDLPVREVANAIINWANSLALSRAIVIDGDIVNNNETIVEMLRQCRYMEMYGQPFLSLTDFYKTIHFDSFVDIFELVCDTDKRTIVDVPDQGSLLYANIYYPKYDKWVQEAIDNKHSKYYQLIKLYWYYVMSCWFDVVIDNSLLDKLSPYTLEQFYVLIRARSTINNRLVVVGTNNLALLSTKHTRPDCVYIIQGGVTKSMFHRSNREIRGGNNLQRLYLGGAFNLPPNECAIR